MKRKCRESLLLRKSCDAEICEMAAALVKPVSPIDAHASSGVHSCATSSNFSIMLYNNRHAIN